MFFGRYISMMNAPITDGFLCTGGNTRPKSTRPGMVMGCYKSRAGMPISKIFQDVKWEEYLAIHLSSLARSCR